MIFWVYLFLILKASKLSDNALVAAVEDTLEECTSILQAVGDFRDDIEDVDVRRRVEKKGGKLANQVENKLESCGKILKAAENFHITNFMMQNMGKIDLKKLETEYVDSLLKSVSKKMGRVLYVASRDGDAASKFHSACDNQGATVVIVETTTGAVFGGYTDNSWTKASNYKTSSYSFLFRLKPSLKHYKIKSANRGKSIYDRADYGPTFGGGHDFNIKDGALSNTQSYTNGGHSYVFSKYPSYELTNGVKNFQVKDYVVLQAIPL